MKIGLLVHGAADLRNQRQAIESIKDKMMRMNKVWTAATTAILLAGPVAADDFTWATGSDPNTMDPHAAATAPVLGFLNNIYEGLVRRDGDMNLEPSLAVAWEPISDIGWRFQLRSGVQFHDGSDFNAEDVIFSFERASSDESDVKSYFATIQDVLAPDPYTVEFYTTQPDPLFPSGIANWLIMDKTWTEAKDAARPNRDGQIATNIEANGTGPFKLTSRVADTETKLEAFADWWDEPTHNITTATMRPVASDATRVAALLSGEVDLIEPVPLQDVPRLAADPGIEVLQGVESRVMFYGFDHQSDGPLADVRVRRAIYQAIDAEAIAEKIMRGNAKVSGLLIGPGVNGYKAADDVRLATDLDAAKASLAEAGYADGFAMTLRCPNDRYINDEAICAATVAMLEKLGLSVALDAVPVSIYWDELRAGEFDMYLLGWSPGTFDAEHPIRFLMHTPDAEAKLGSWNFGGYSNPRVDELLPAIQTEIDQSTRQAMIDEVHGILKSDVVYAPLHVQPLVWAVKGNTSVTQRPDNFFLLRWVQIDGF